MKIGNQFKSTVVMDNDDDTGMIVTPAGSTWTVQETYPESNEVLLKCRETGGSHVATPEELVKKGFVSI